MVYIGVIDRRTDSGVTRNGGSWSKYRGGPLSFSFTPFPPIPSLLSSSLYFPSLHFPSLSLVLSDLPLLSLPLEVGPIKPS